MINNESQIIIPCQASIFGINMHRIIALILLLALSPTRLYCWGFFGHRKINRLAVYTLPSELMGFFKQNINFITDHAVDPDMRRYAMEGEAPRHYIDIDHYGEEPFKNVPRKWNDAVAKFSEDTLQAYGIVPWHIQVMYYRLINAYKSGEVGYILKTAADLGHYVADAHVPLHTTENYNGQITGQHGIHGFWESRLPELFSENYDFIVGRAEYINSPLDVAWDAVEKSHAAVDSVLKFERTLTADYPSDRKYGFEERGRSTVKTYSRDFSLQYHEMLNGMVERRMRASIRITGSLWYSAWIDAGQPALINQFKTEEQLKIEDETKQLEADYSNHKVKSREHEE